MHIPRILILLLLSCAAHAQIVKLSTSSSTNWSGGVAGHYGTNYNFTIDFVGYNKDSLLADTLWIGNKCIPLVLKSKSGAGAYDAVRKITKNKTSYFLTAGTDNTDNPDYPNPYANTIKKNPGNKPPIKYKGVALLSYRYCGQRYFFTISKVITVNPPINYP